jgi:hypothetical protein
MKRRTFLQVTGASASAAVLPTANATAPAPNSVTLTGLVVGSMVLVAELSPGTGAGKEIHPDQIVYRDRVTSDTLRIETDWTEELLIRVRKVGWRTFELHLGPGPGEHVVNVAMKPDFVMDVSWPA